MKGMPSLYYATLDESQPRWIGSVLYATADAAEVRRLYREEDAEPLPRHDQGAGRTRASLSAFVRRLVGVAGATT